MGIKKNNGQKFWEVQEGIKGKILSILGSSLPAVDGIKIFDNDDQAA